jgi:ATP-binding cassette subfamily B protein
MIKQAKLKDYLKLIFIKYKIYFISMFVLAIAASLFEVSVNYKIKEIIDGIANHQSTRQINIILLLFVIYKLLHHGMFFIRRLFDIKYKPALVSQITIDIYSKIIGHSLHWFDSHLSGEIASKISGFQTSLSNIITYSFRTLVILAAIIIGMIFLLQVNLVSVAVIFIFAIIYCPIILILLKKQIQLQKDYVDADQETSGIINDSIANIFSIKIIGNIFSELKLKLMPAILHRQSSDKKSREFDAYFVDNADTIMVVIMSAVQIYLLSHLYSISQISAGGFAFVMMITLKIHSDLDQMLETILFSINPAIASLKASFSLIGSDYDIEDKKDAKILSNIKGEIKFSNVNFAYQDCRHNVLNDFNLTIKAGQKIGIVGATGAGKTTIIKCLLRYFDISKGAILIDNHDIRNVTQESLRANISVIPQDITMFHRTILQNLQLAKYDATFNEIVDACKKARIHYDITNMQHGYNSIVGERGVKVSGGQRQRIAIARAILKDAPILILDEATSSLDSKTEKYIQESLNILIEDKNKTVIAIAHRLSTIKHMDKIIVLDKGKIVEEGSHEELIDKADSIYRKLWELQEI